MIRVAFDGHFLSTPYSGNGRYTAGLLNALRSVSASYDAHVYAYGPKEATAEYALDAAVSCRRMRRVLVDVPRILKRHQVHIHHAQYTMRPDSSVVSCLTVHDTAFAQKDLPEYSPWKLLVVRYQSLRVDAIVTVSDAARVELESLLPNRHAPIHAIPNGVCISTSTESDWIAVDKMLFGLQPPHVLYVGRMARRKRVPLLVAGFRAFRRDYGGSLILVGSPDDDAAQVSELIRGDASIRWFRDVSEGAKAALLRMASAFAYLSRYEGFGLPVVEALRVGIPVVITETPTLTGIAGSVAIVVDPSPVAIARGLLDAVSSALDPGRVTDRQRVAAAYTWDRAAKTTMEMYLALIAQGVGKWQR